MKFYLSCLLALALFYPNITNAQENKDKKEKIAKALTDYFHLERENIHVHFDKNIFLTNEQIWFKGYVFHRKLNIPFFATTNIYASLIDGNGNILDTQLLYGNIASFSGSFKLNESFKSGKYYLQFYTNWMNNFIEDESAVYEVEIINPEQGIASALGRPSLSGINITLHPEGGTYLQDASNSIGIHVSDCNNNAVPVSSVDIVTPAGEVIKTVQINKLGYGRFDLAANSPAGLKAVATVKGVKYEQELPPAQLKGIALEINNYAVADKLIAKIKTNKLTNTSYEGKPFYLVLQQDEKTVISEFNFKDGKLDQTIVIPQKDLFDGTNTVRILDYDLNQLAERLIFKYSKITLASDLAFSKSTSESKELAGKINYPTMNVSISVLPDETASIYDNNDMLGNLLIAPYIESKRAAGRYYLEAFSKNKHYELDLFLVNQTSKYNWRDIMLNPPKSTYTFDMGLSLKATLNNKIPNKKDHKVRVYSLKGMFDEKVDINDKNEIFVDNLIVADSTEISFSLLEKGVQKQELKLYPQIFNNNRKFNKPYKPAAAECVVKKEELVNFDIPAIGKNTVVLEEVEVTADRRTELKHKGSPGTSQLRGYKITDVESKSFFYILDYIRYHGFDVENNGVSVGIYGRTTNTINGQRTTPMIYMDNMQVTDFSLLQGIQTADVDEFYINQHAVVPSVNNKMGIVRIFMKKNFSFRAKKQTDASYIVKGGFAEVQPFENANYMSTSDSGFESFGLIDWQPVILPDPNGEFTVKLPYTGQNSVKVLIEGFSADGKIISEIKTINLN